jgi:drug/metabolite transporter (DMT)-like permease
MTGRDSATTLDPIVHCIESHALIRRYSFRPICRTIRKALILTTPASGSYAPKLNNVRGILWMLLAVTTLTTMFVVVKQMATELPIFVVAIARTFFALCMLTPWLIRSGPAVLRTHRPGLHFIRAFCGISAFVTLIFALEDLILADAMVLAFTSPFWSILIGAIVLKELIRGRRIAATVVGFCGMLLIVKPHLGVEPAMLLALGSAVLTSSAMISMKNLSSTEPPTRIVFYFMFFGTLILLPGAAYTWETPTLTQTGWLFLAGVLGAIGQDFLARAYDAGEVSIVAPFDFMRLPVAAILGFLVFSEIPDQWSIIGTLIIISSAVYLLRRGHVERREAKNDAPGS